MARAKAEAGSCVMAMTCALLWAQGVSAALMALGGMPGAAVMRLSIGFAVLSIPFAGAALAALWVATRLGKRTGPAWTLCVAALGGACYVLRVTPHEGRLTWIDAMALVLCVGIPLGLAVALTCMAARRAETWVRETRQRRGDGGGKAASASVR